MFMYESHLSAKMYFIELEVNAHRSWEFVNA